MAATRWLPRKTLANGTGTVRAPDVSCGNLGFVDNEGQGSTPGGGRATPRPSVLRPGEEPGLHEALERPVQNAIDVTRFVAGSMILD